jgi:DNA replication ATP-dependent helicase Dna2
MQVAASQRYLSQAAAHLNADQTEAVARVTRMRDYVLVLGMPGTGKTTTVVHIVKALMLCGCSVLISSYTNSALDNILIKLIEEQEQEAQASSSQHNHDRPNGPDNDLHFLRIGSSHSVHPRVRPYLPGMRATLRPPRRRSRGSRRARGSSTTTCLSCRNPLLAHRTFDVAIVDEASQISLPCVLGPLLRARSFLLVGDHYQLPPLVTSRDAAECGLKDSLFR